jgi:lipoprotein-anchoring transpeptidase ErfK/SrfK
MKRASRFLISVIVAVLSLTLVFPATSYAAHEQQVTVRRGDTLSGLAVRYDTTVAAIMRANGIKRARDIKAGQRLRIPTAGTVGRAEAAPAAVNALPAGVPKRGKAIYVSISKQRMYVYSNGRLVYNWLVSTGLPKSATKAGNFRVQTKIPEAWSSIWQLRMPYWMGIYYVGRVENGIHALPINRRGQKLWGGLLGRRASFGCVILSTQNAATLYRWAPAGTPVIIRY